MGVLEQLDCKSDKIIELLQSLQPVHADKIGINWNQFYTADELAQLLRISRNSIYQTEGLIKTKTGPNGGTTIYWGAHVLHHLKIISDEQLQTLKNAL